MRRKHKPSRTPAVACALVMLALPWAHAADVSDPPSADLGVAGNTLPDGELDGQTGGYASSTTATQTSTVTGNTLTDSYTGANEIGAGSFAGLSGVATIIQNTGNQVSIQTSTVVNVSLN